MRNLFKPFILCITIINATIVSSFAQQVQFFSPFPSDHCKNWNDSVEKIGIMNYILGYISAAAVYSGDDNNRGLLNKDILDYVDRYCRAHPEDTIYKLAKTLFDTSAGRR